MPWKTVKKQLDLALPKFWANQHFQVEEEDLQCKRCRETHMPLRFKHELCIVLYIIDIQIITVHIHLFIAVVPHKAVAEVSSIGNYRRGELL